MANSNLAKATNSTLTAAEVNTLLADDGSGNFGIGTSTPSTPLEVIGKTVLSRAQATPIGTASTIFDDLTLGSTNTTNTGMTIFGSGQTGISFADSAGNEQGQVRYQHSSDSLQFLTNAALTLIINSAGVVSAGNETSPDASAGGLTLQQNAEDGNILTLKSSDVDHGITSFGETDTYAQFLKGSSTGGGFSMSCFTEGNAGFIADIYASAEVTTDDSSSTGNIFLRTFFKSGTGRTAHGDTANILSVINDANTRMLIKGNGDMHVTNTTLVALDNEDDIQLVQDLRYATSGNGYKHKVSKKGMKSLIKHKVLSSKGDFQILQGVNALSLGAIGQLWNMIKGLGKQLNLNENQLKQLAKQY